MKIKTPYQDRMSTFVGWGSLYAILTPILIWWKMPDHLQPIAWMAFLSVLYLTVIIATAADAIFDSLMERIDSGYPIDPGGTRL